jgi:hydroxymethylpyrimidine/phosphomethylpyrimidine kinase
MTRGARRTPLAPQNPSIRALRFASPALPSALPRAACALTIAGLDPSGGAGLTADLRGFAEAGAWGCAVCAVLTVQSTAGLRAVQAVAPELVLDQAREVLTHQRVRAVKTGALGSAANVRAVATLLGEHPDLPLVVDPVMIATRAPGGARLLDGEALEAMQRLCARALVITPNRDEAEALLGGRIDSLRAQREAARELVARGSFAALIKGGHLPGEDAVDVLALRGGALLQLRAARRQQQEFHGGGCFLAACIAGHLAAHDAPPSAAAIEAAVRFAKRRLTRAVAAATDIGDGLLVLGPSPRPRG